MCIIGIAKNYHPDYPFILAANRDEFYERPAKEAHFWEDNRFVVGGRDLEKGGSWLGIDADGNIAALTNIRNSRKRRGPPFSTRGALVTSYFTDRASFHHYMSKKNSFDGFNILYGNYKEITYESSAFEKKKILNNKLHVLSNASLDTPWPKASELKRGLAQVKDYNGQSLTGYLLEQLASNKSFPDTLLPETGVGPDLEKKLSPVFIETPVYGTRNSTVILINRDGEVTLTEVSYKPEFKKITYQFLIR